MAIQGPYKVECGELFPFGLGVLGPVEPSADYEKSTKENRVQARDKVTGLLLWQVEVVDFDPQAREKTFRVKIAAEVQPVPPEVMSAQVPVRLVVLEGLQVMPYLVEVVNPRASRSKDRAGGRNDEPATIQRIAFSLKCAGLAAPGARRSVDASKAA